MHKYKSLKYKFFSILFLLFYTLSLRFPGGSVEFSRGSDSHAHHMQTLFIIEKGYIPWIVNFRSYFGMYPYTEPVLARVLTASISEVTGISVELGIIPFCLSLSIIGLGSIFMFSHEYFKSFLPAFIACLLFTSDLYFFKHTLWRLTERGVFMALIPLIYWILFKFADSSILAKRFSYRNIILAILSLFLIFTAHRMNAFLIPALISPYFLAFTLSYLNNRYKFISKEKRYYMNLLILIYLPVTVILILYTDIMAQIGYPRAVNLNESDFDNILLNYVKSYAIEGFLFLFAPFGALVLIFKKRTIKDNMLLTMLLFQIPFSFDKMYFLPVFVPIVALLASQAFYINFSFLRQSYKSVLVIIIIFSTVFVAAYERDLNTRQQILRDQNPEYHENEYWNAAFWREENFAEDSMGFYDHPIWIKLTFSGTFLVVDDKVLVYNNTSYLETLQVEEYEIIEIIFQQKDYYYGGEIYHPISQEKGIARHHHQWIILNQIEIGYPNSEILEDYYKIDYLIECKINYENGGWTGTIDNHESSEYPIYIRAYESNYKIFDNEVYNFYDF